MKISLHGYLEENLQDYRKASMFLAFPKCTFKCAHDLGLDPEDICQNYFNINSPIIEYEMEDIWDIYKNNILTESFVCGGLEPFMSKEDLYNFINFIREEKKCEDDIVIYTGYNEEEIKEEIIFLKKYKNIYVKFGRYIPNQNRHYDEVLGVNLANEEQYGKKISEKDHKTIIKLNPDGEIVEKIRNKLKEDRHCPCRIEQTEDTICMCKEFREQEEGMCHCGLYIKEKI